MIDSTVNNDIIETKKLNEKADKVEKPEDVAAVIRQYEDIIRANKKNIISTRIIKEKFSKDSRTRKSSSK